MRLLVVTNRYPANQDDSAAPFMPDFVRALAATGATVEVVTPDYGVRPCDESSTVHRFPAATAGRVVGSLRPWWPPDAVALARTLRHWGQATLAAAGHLRATALVACWALPSGWVVRDAARRLGIPYGVWCLGSDLLVWGRHPIGKHWVRAVLRDAGVCWADGFDLADRAERLTGGVCSFLPSLHELPSPMSLPDEMRADGRVVLLAGRLEKSKGVLTFLTAADQLLRESSEIEIQIAGWGALEEHVRRWARHPDRRDRVRFLGRQTPAMVAALLGQCACCVIPTTLDSIPLIFGEAVQAGAPLVVSDYGDLPELVRRHALGRVFGAGDAEQLAAAVCQVVAAGREALDPTRCGQLCDQFSPARAADRVVTDLAEVRRHV